MRANASSACTGGYLLSTLLGPLWVDRAPWRIAAIVGAVATAAAMLWSASAGGVPFLPFAAFGPGTDSGDTRAKPNIWTDNAKFTAAATKMQEEMAKLNAAAKTGNLDQIKAAFGPVGGACKACHDDFRKE